MSEIITDENVTDEEMKPMCGRCYKTVEKLAVWTDTDKLTATLFCPHCRGIFGTQLLPNGIAQLARKKK